MTAFAVASHPRYAKEIEYDRHAHQFAMRLNGETIGYAEWYLQAEESLDELVASIVASADPDGGGPSPDLDGDEGDTCPPDFVKAIEEIRAVREHDDEQMRRARAPQCDTCLSSNAATHTVETTDLRTGWVEAMHLCGPCMAKWRTIT